MNDNNRRVGLDVERLLILLTFELHEVHLLALGVDRDGPHTSCGQLDLGVGTLGVVEPCVGIVDNGAGRLQGRALEGTVVTANGRDHHLVHPSVLLALRTDGGHDEVVVDGELSSVVEVVLNTGSGVGRSHEVALVELHERQREVVEVEVDGILVLRVQVEGNRPSVGSLLRNGHDTIVLLPLGGEVDVANGLIEHVVRGILVVELGVGGSSLRSLVAEVELELRANLQHLRRLNPELVVPCRGIALGVGHLSVNDEDVRAVNLLDVGGEGIPTVALVHVAAFLLSPSADLEVVLLVVEAHVGISPRLLGVTILELLDPLYGALLLAFVGDLQVSDIPIANIVTALHEEVTVVAGCLVVDSTLDPVGRDGELTIRSQTEAEHGNVLSNRTLDLVVERVDNAYLSIDTTDGEELAVPRGIGSFLAVEVETAILDGKACTS